MGQINQYLIKNISFNYFQFTEFTSIIFKNDKFFEKNFKIKHSLFSKFVFFKKINTPKKCINIIYF